MQKMINQADAAGFTIPVERPRNKENRWKMIEKKRDMSLLTMMINTKRHETLNLENYTVMRKEGLK